MKKITLLILACIISTPVHAQSIATVNGKSITQKDVDQFVKLMITQGAVDSPKLREQVKQKLVNLQVLEQTARKQKLEKRTETQIEIDLSSQTILAHALMDDFLQKHPITEAQIKSEYNKLKAEQSGKQEYRIKHIQVDDERQANELLSQIKEDKSKFRALAKEYSTDKGSAHDGGLLPWGQASNYVSVLEQEIVKLEEGGLANKPIYIEDDNSQKHWHIVMLESVRLVEFPEIDDLYPQIENMLREQILSDYQKELRSNARIEWQPTS